MYQRWSSSKPSPCALLPNSVFSLVIICRTLVGAQDPLPVVRAAVEHGLGQDAEIAGGGEDASVPGDAAERPGVLVVHLAPHHPAVGDGLELGGGDPVPLDPGGRVVAGVAHPQRAGDAVARPAGRATSR